MPNEIPDVTWFVPSSIAKVHIIANFYNTNSDEPFFLDNQGNVTTSAFCGELVEISSTTGETRIQPTLTPTSSYFYIDPNVSYSPQKTFQVECNFLDGKSSLYRANGHRLVSSNNINVCDGAWAPNESAFAYISQSEDPTHGKAFIWSTNGEIPIQLGDTANDSIVWSPDSNYILIVIGAGDPSKDVEINTISIFDHDGRKINRFTIDGHLRNNCIFWHTNRILDIQSHDGSFGTIHNYYDSISGEFLGDWYEDHTGFTVAQSSMISPDRHWQIVDNTPLNNPPPHVYKYSLIDLIKGRVSYISEGPDQQLQFVTWSANSQTFYLVNRPASSTAVARQNMPFGFLAFDVNSMKYTILFDQAMFVKFNPDQRLAWVVFPVQRPDGSSGLDGIIYNLEQKTQSERQFISNKMIYGNPAEGNLLPVEWASDGSKLVFMDEEHNLSLLFTNGMKVSLGKGVVSDKPNDPISGHVFGFGWSPDNRWLSVRAGSLLWILDTRSSP